MPWLNVYFETNYWWSLSHFCFLNILYIDIVNISTQCERNNLSLLHPHATMRWLSPSNYLMCSCKCGLRVCLLMHGNEHAAVGSAGLTDEQIEQQTPETERDRLNTKPSGVLIVVEHRLPQHKYTDTHFSIANPDLAQLRQNGARTTIQLTYSLFVGMGIGKYGRGLRIRIKMATHL